MNLNNKKIIIGITGGIAAYKICELIRQLIKLNADVRVVLTPSAKEFVTATTIRTLSKNQVYCEQFHVENWQPEHISLADSADLFIIAPASANTIGKIANGICDNLLTSLITAFKKPVIFAPAMNCNMWENKFVQKNIMSLEEAGFHIIEPETGELACGYEGTGRMASIDRILNKAIELLNSQSFLKDKKVIITAGGTQEPVDPVRYLGNISSGKMGIALADAAFEAGAKVSLISTVNVNKPYKVIPVKTAEDMLKTTKQEFTSCDALIMAAAVADFRPKEIAQNKIKKEKTDTITLELVKNPDILKEVSKDKKSNQLLIGFCAESEDLINNAVKKIMDKNLDFIVANDISNPDIGFESDYNAVTLIDKKGDMTEFARATKNEIARTLLRNIFNG